jgi:hypothetical protein
VTEPMELADALRGALEPRTSLIHPTYRHLSRSMTIAGLNVAQWVIVVCGLALTWALSTLLPLPSEWSLSAAGTVCGVPASVLFVLSAEGDFDARPLVTGVLSWRRSARVLLPVAEVQPPSGYRLLPDAATPPRQRRPAELNHFQAHELWSEAAGDSER